MTDNNFKTVKEIAQLLRVNPITVYGLIEERQLSAIRIGRTYRIEWSAFLNFIESRKIS